ncbi:hypothetical protein CNMCM5793_005548 [Aspergillus hiratsukae]|uniref:Uncharacterized protein n=1 Tax=Aspergillus hiratsukae TaxID=1194566 RepID=A0A8H6P4I1_9EURO|nr:hypothetical protein CNMCM5793_005548 [Aspergillus hiratsukae]KAF7172289.1 hypothetical protein CNMCM6106_006544 [Aspergillus hiratsukae]
MTLRFSFVVSVFLVLSVPQLQYTFGQDIAVSPGAAVVPVEHMPMVSDRSGGCHSTESIFRGNGSARSVLQSDEIPQDLARLRPKPLVTGYPLIQTKGIARGDKFLYIADTGKDDTHNESAKIWKLDPVTKNLTVLYTGPLLVTGKWLYFKEADPNGPAEVVVSDYGEEPSSRSPGTGKGAKVFAIQLDENGDANHTRVLFEGAPLRSPEGIVVIGDSVILADWAAGPNTSLPDRPGTFNAGKVFEIPLAGGSPVERFADHTWVTLIGTCQYADEDGRTFLRLIDIDGGRPAGNLALPQSGLAQFYRSELISTSPLILGMLEKVTYREEYQMEVDIPGLQEGDIVEIQAERGGVFANGGVLKKMSIPDQAPKTLSFHIESDRDAPSVAFITTVIRNQTILDTVLTEKTKSLPDPTLQDNKHAGSAAASLQDVPRLSASADGTSQSVSWIAPKGGVPVTIWQGEPLGQPMGVMYSWDAEKIWVTDQAGGSNKTAAVF